MQSHTTKLSTFAVAAILGFVGSSPTRAEINGLAVTSAKDIGPFRGKAYKEVEAKLQGTAPGGSLCCSGHYDLSQTGVRP